MKSFNFITLSFIVSSCAVVTAIGTGLASVGAWAGGITSGRGLVVDGMQQGEWTYAGKSGETLAIGTFKDDEPHGPWADFYPNGNKEKEGTIAEGRRLGLWRYYHTNGFNKALGYFEDGREFGQWNFWSPQGKRSQLGCYLEGQQTNQWTSWHGNGSKRSEGWFYEGQSVGPWQLWTPAGELSQKDFGLPPGLEIVAEQWPEGGPRRRGFLMNRKQHGLWQVLHRNGAPRLVGSFEDGLASGPWMAFAKNGERVAAGQMLAGRPSGAWTLWENGSERPWSSDGASPALPMIGEWSPDELASSAGVEAALGTWLAEASSSIEQASITHSERAPIQAASPAILAQATEEPEIPVTSRPLTQREREERPAWVKAYRKIGGEGKVLASRYASRIAKASKVVRSGGDPEGAKRYLGKPLPLTEFQNQDGTPVFLDEMRGEAIVLVILRGFAGEVCVYCMTQTEVLCESGALDRFEELGAKLLVLFPGGKNTLGAFRSAYEALGAEEIPPYSLLYKHDLTVAKRMHLAGDKVIPSTFIMDAEGIVRFAYLGEHEADRPAVELLYKELEKLEKR